MKIKRVSDKFVRNFKVRICHISDTHSGFPRLYGRYDCVLHTGDFFPNSHHVMQGNKNREAVFQLQWLRDNMANIKAWLQGHPFLFVLGNHDFVPAEMMEQELRSFGIDARNITNKHFNFREVDFYGFPYVPVISGMWNYEKDLPEMQIEVDKLVEILNAKHVDVLACHAPLYQTLDLSMGNELCGSTIIANGLDYKVSKDMLPGYYLCGHIHEANGITIRNGMVISNAATTLHVIEV